MDEEVVASAGGSSLATITVTDEALEDAGEAAPGATEAPAAGA